MDPQQFTTMGILGLILTLLTMGLKFFSQKYSDNQKAIDELDKEIDNAKSFIDFVRIDDKLRNK